MFNSPCILYIFYIQSNCCVTIDDYSRHPTLASCYQLVQSVLKMSSELELGWDRERWMDVRKALVGTGWAIFSFHAQMGIENTPFTS